MSTIHAEKPFIPPNSPTSPPTGSVSHPHMPAADTDELESPLARLTPEQLEQLGREFDAIHDEVKA